MQLQQLIDRMIDQAASRDPDGKYNILVGADPTTELDWVHGKTVYRWCPVIQSRLVPNSVVILAPAPSNLRSHDLVEYRGGIRNGDVTRHTIVRRRTTRMAGATLPRWASLE